MKSELKHWLRETAARMPTPNENFDQQEFERQKIRIRQQLLPNLEKHHAALLKDDFKPRAGWWQETGK